MITIANYCVGCAFCKLVCPEEAIDVFGVAKINHDRCKSCKKCVIWCPVEALKVVEE